MRSLLLALAVLTAPSAALAQAPRITPAGDPSVRNDTIYRLAVNPADHPDDDYIYLLDDGVVRFEADGRGSRTYRQVIQVLTQDGAEAWGEQSFSYSSGSERLTVNWIRVLRSNGQVISTQPAHEQESLAPVALEAPVYSDQRIRRVTLSGLAPGTLVDWSYTIERTVPVLPGDYYTAWRVTTGLLTRRSRFIVDVPAAGRPRIHEENVRFRRAVTEAKGRRVHTWATAEVPKIDPEPFMASPNTLHVRIEVAAPITWGAIASWYAKLAADRYALTPQLEHELNNRVRAARTLDDSLRALHRWIAQDFRYVSLSLGIGGYRPRFPAEVLEARYGDCKDKATLFIALARRLGVPAYPVLLSSTGTADSALPTVQQFDHMIAAVDRPGDEGPRRLYLDLTSDLTPYGELPPAEQGSFALVVRDDGTAEEVRLPDVDVLANRSETTMVGAIDADGVFTGRFMESKSGSLQYGLRQAYARSFSQDELSRMSHALANGVFPGSLGDSLAIFDGRDLTAAPVIAVTVREARVVSASGGTRIFTLPAAMPNFASLGLAGQLERSRPRRFPIDAAAVMGPVDLITDFRVTLPAGWRAVLPSAVTARSVFGSYSADYRQEGRELRITRRITGRSGVEPPDRLDELIAWLRAISQDDVRFIVLETTR